jgi:vacuolar-type H+-ATPase subunit I/STV1
MKKVTIITLPEYESFILESLGKSRVTQLKQVTGPDFESLKEAATDVDYKGLYQKVHSRYLELLELGDMDIERVTPSIEERRRLAEAPEAEVETVLEEMEKIVSKLQATREKLDSTRVKLEAVRALQPEEFKRCIAVGVVKNEIIERLEDYMKRYPDTSSKAVGISPDESFLFIFGSEENRNWIDALFLVFNVKDIFNVLETGDILLVLDPEKRSEAIEGYEEEMKRIEEERRALTLNRIANLDYLLKILSNKRAPVLRTKIISILQGWVPDNKVEVLENEIGEIESQIGEKMFIWFEDPEHEEHNVPNPAPNLQPSFLQPAWTLTTLRGWPNAHELNPGYITILIFSLQFGLMFGDVGQGAIFLLLGLIFTWKFKTGMASKIGVMFIPMGVSSIIFGFLYGEVFLMEGLIHPILFSPLHHIGTLMKTILGVAVAEICFSLILSSINHVKEGDYIGVFGEHGLGAILFIVGLYLGGMEFLGGLTMGEIFSHWTFYMMLTGLILAALVPLISAIVHREVGIDVMGEMISALMMTFVESLASFFSFLRIAAFALAHASLALAAHALSHSMSPIIGLLLTNAIAMTFEFMSSSVQSLRLLYYEVMSRFFHGGGTRFRPFKLRQQSKVAA